MSRTHRNPRPPGRRSRSLTLVLAAALVAPVAWTAPAAARETHPFRDPRLSVDARVGDLLGRLTLDEKVSLLHQYQPAIPRLGIGRFKTGTEALHGVAWSTDVHNSYPTTLTWEQENVPAILWTSHAGAETGNALASVLFGDDSPSGKLPQTWYRSEEQLPDILDYDIIKSDRTYQYFNGKPLYPFGHGLSYTTFQYGKPRLSSHSVGRDGTVTVTVPVTNTGRRAGDEVVQLYTHQRTSRVKQPVKKLRAFAKVHVEPGRTVQAQLRFRASDLAIWDVTRNRWTVEKSRQDLLIGSSSADIRRHAALDVRGERIPDRDLSKPTRAADFDDQNGIELVDETKVKGDAVAGAAGSWLKFADAGLGRSTGTITAKAAGTSAAAIQVRLDRPDGPLAGTLNVPATGDKYTYTEVTAPLGGARGDHDVYLVFTGETRLSTFSLT